MNREQMVSKSELTGFRTPTEYEKEKMSNFVLADLKRQKKWIQISKWFSGILAVFLLLSAVFGGSAKPLGESLVVLVIGIIALMGFIYIYKRQKVQKVLLKKITTGEFEVMECFAFDADPGADLVGEGTVQIFNKNGQYCRDGFAVDRESSAAWKTIPNYPFWLMKCNYSSINDQKEKDVYYELFSKSKLERV